MALTHFIQKTFSVKICRICFSPKLRHNFYPDSTNNDGLRRECRICTLKANKNYYQTHKNKMKGRSKRYWWMNHEAALRRQRRYKAKPETKVKAKEYRKSTRLEALNKYGGRCACCGEKQYEFLAIDHINGDGSKHRREINGAPIHGWLKKQGYPDGFRILCHNCNFAKAKYGRCPHNLLG